MNLKTLNRRHFVGTSLAGLTALGARAHAAENDAPAIPGPFVYPFRIGELEAWSISDASLHLGEGLDLMWPVEERPEMERTLIAHGEGTATLPLYVNVLVVRSGREIILFDAGFGRSGNPKLGWLGDGLRQIGIDPDDVTAGFLSHAHADHLDGFVIDGRPAFPNAAFFLLEDEWRFWRERDPDFSKTNRDRSRIPGMIRSVREQFEILQPHVQHLKDGDRVLGGLVTALAAPGHTAGHACFRIRSGDHELFHLMDLAHHHLLMFADPAWNIAFDHDPETAVASRKKLWARAATDRARCFGFHLPWPGLGRILADKPGYRWWPEAWQWHG